MKFKIGDMVVVADIGKINDSQLIKAGMVGEIKSLSYPRRLGISHDLTTDLVLVEFIEWIDGHGGLFGSKPVGKRVREGYGWWVKREALKLATPERVALTKLRS